MIVKNEARTLPRLAASLDGQLDNWTIVDTGSTDLTVQIAEEVVAGVEGELIHDEWRGYGPSRNVAPFQAREHSDLILTVDADDTFHGEMERAVPGEFRRGRSRLLRGAPPVLGAPTCASGRRMGVEGSSARIPHDARESRPTVPHDEIPHRSPCGRRKPRRQIPARARPAPGGPPR